MIIIRYKKYALCVLLLLNGFIGSVQAEDYYTYGSTSFNGFAPQSYGNYVFAVGTDDKIHAWNVNIPAAADANNRNYQGKGTFASSTFTPIGTKNLGFKPQSRQASRYVSKDKIWYGPVLRNTFGKPTEDIIPYEWYPKFVPTTEEPEITAERDKDSEIIPTTETIEDFELIVYDESTDTWYARSKNGEIYHLDKDNNWVKDKINAPIITPGVIDIVDELLLVSGMTGDVIAAYEKNAIDDVWEILDINEDGNRDEKDQYIGNNPVAVLEGLEGGPLQTLTSRRTNPTVQQGLSAVAFAVPEPSVLLLFMSNLFVFAYLRRKKFI